MKVFVKFNIGSRERVGAGLTEGEQEVSPDVGKALIACGYADPLEEVVQAIPAKASIKGVKTKKVDE